MELEKIREGLKMRFIDVLFKAWFIILRKIKKTSQEVKDKFKCQIFLSYLTYLSCLSRYLGCPVCLHGYDNYDDHDDHDDHHYNDDHDHKDPNDHDRGYLIQFNFQPRVFQMHGVLLSEIFRYSAARAAKIIFLYPLIFVVAFSRSVTSFSLAALREAAKYYLADFFPLT